MTLGIDTENHMLESAQDGQRILARIDGNAASSLSLLISEYTELRDRVKLLVDGLPKHHTDPELCAACDAVARMCPYHTGRADSWAYLSQAMRLVASGDSSYAVLVLEHADANGDEA
ncbi:hypothetical protein ACJ6WE_39965 [Streptomyces sp. MMS24-I31]|uniref:hypothetical protein n=1 Tax=Streptomyces sp. MMS24-I31 TaxID=3351563 RepID=UPI003896CCBC